MSGVSRALLIAAVTLALTAEAALPTETGKTIEKFCSAWKRIAPTQPVYRDAFAKVLAEMSKEDLDPSWRKHLVVLGSAGEAEHLGLFKTFASDDSITFSCESFEFPTGKPEGDRWLEIEGITALAADETGVYALSGSSLLRLDAGKPTVLSNKLPPGTIEAELLLDGKDALILLNNALIAVPKKGGAPKKLADAGGTGLLLQGKWLYFTGLGEVRRVPRKGGKVETVAKGLGKARLVLPVGKGFVFTRPSEDLYRIATAAAQIETVEGGPVDHPVVLGAAMVFLQVSSLSRYAAGKIEALGPKAQSAHLIASRGEVLAIDASENWPGKYRVVKWKPGSSEWVTLARNVGSAHLIAADAKRVYWVDSRDGALMSAAR